MSILSQFLAAFRNILPYASVKGELSESDLQHIELEENARLQETYYSSLPEKLRKEHSLQECYYRAMNDSRENELDS